MVALPQTVAAERARAGELLHRVERTVTPEEVVDVMTDFAAASLVLEAFLTSRRTRLEALRPFFEDWPDSVDAQLAVLRQFEHTLGRDREQATEVATKARLLLWTSVPAWAIDDIRRQVKDLNEKWQYAELFERALETLEAELPARLPPIDGLDEQLSAHVRRLERAFAFDLAVLGKL